MMSRMRHLDLFSGIGGFALAASQVLGAGHEVVSFCEIEPFAQKVLKKHWPDVPIIQDIRDIKGEDFEAIDLITGGFPCQPFSCAGKQRGKEDDRYLWPEMLRVISGVRPTWIIGENVAGIVKMELDTVLVDLENEGYECQPFIIPACAVDAPHRRDRVWIVAHYANPRIEGLRRERENSVFQNSDDPNAPQHMLDRPRHNRQGGRRKFTNTDCHATNTGCIRQTKQEQQTKRCEQYNSDATDTCNQRLQRSERAKSYEKRQAAYGSTAECNNAWDEPWIEAATRFCGMDDGVPNRTHRLKALGNAIVPQVVVPIMQAIKDLTNE